jgi:hypothetical protein
MKRIKRLDAEVYICNPSTQRCRQEDHEFGASLGYIAKQKRKRKREKKDCGKTFFQTT